MITSDKNPKIQQVRALIDHAKERKTSSSFVIEGVRLVGEAFLAQWELQLILISDNLSPHGREIVAAARKQAINVEEIPPQMMAKLGDTTTPQGILAIASFPVPKLPERLNFTLICDAIRDPGNLGTILRTAQAAGVQALVLSPGTTDPFAPKVVRAGMGAHFHLPIFQFNWPEIQAVCQHSHLNVYLASAGSSTYYWQVNLIEPTAIIIGGEAEGASQEAKKLASQTISIPMPGQSESLNAAISAGILLFETVRQRSQ